MSDLEVMLIILAALPISLASAVAIIGCFVVWLLCGAWVFKQLEPIADWMGDLLDRQM